jgi:hypothetical protein
MISAKIHVIVISPNVLDIIMVAVQNPEIEMQQYLAYFKTRA